MHNRPPESAGFTPPAYETLYEAAQRLPESSRHFLAYNPELALQKFYLLRCTPGNKRQGYYDFDKFLTKANGSIYQRIYKRMPQEGQDASDLIRQECLAEENSPAGLPDEKREAWTDYEISLYKKYKLTREDVRLAMAGDRLRPGALRTIESSLATGMSTGIISQGLKDAIKECEDLPWGNAMLRVYSNSLVYNDADEIQGRSSVDRVNARNKHQYARRMFEEAGIPRNECMVLVGGDSLHDAAMVPHGALPPERVLRICMPPTPEVSAEFLYQALVPGATEYPPYDVVLLGTDSLDSMADLLDWSVGKPVR